MSNVNSKEFHIISPPEGGKESRLMVERIGHLVNGEMLKNTLYLDYRIVTLTLILATIHFISI